MLQPMRFAPSALALLALPALAFAPACRRAEAPPPPPPPAAPVSIWGHADSLEVATRVVDAAARDAWTSQFRDRNGRAATIAVGQIVDRSGQTVPVAGLAQAIDAALASAGGDKLASGTAASDYVLGGVIAASPGTTADGVAATFFAIDLTLVERASGDTTWHFAVEWPVTGR